MKRSHLTRAAAAALVASGLAACGGGDGAGRSGSLGAAGATIAPPVISPVGGAGASASAGSSPSAAGSGGTRAATAGTFAMPPVAVAGSTAVAGSGGAMAAAGTGGSSTAGGMAPPTGMGDGSDCPAPPSGASPEAIIAYDTLNAARVPAGAGCANNVLALNMSALNHCQYNAMNAGNASCAAGGHNEVMGCPGFTGVDVAAREKAAGYSAMGATEVLTSYGNMPAPATQSWIDTVWHRIPMIDPWTVDMGYGGAARCDVIDFGRGMPTAPSDTVVVYPYDGQINVPPSFNGLEAPAPIAPPSGWPSGYPINIYAQALQVTEHVLTKDGDTTPIEHVWMDMNSPEVMSGYRFYLRTTAFMYSHTPLAANTKYRVRITGTHTGGELNAEWTFTTGAMRRF